MKWNQNLNSCVVTLNSNKNSIFVIDYIFLSIIKSVIDSLYNSLRKNKKEIYWMIFKTKSIYYRN